MHRSSESVAALAAALAKAQAELVNPEKSLTATIRTGQPGEAGRSFRYAPLASGLDIVRKTLGRHEIATVQTTIIDPAAGVLNLSTMLAHASGEWIASDWPICPIADMASPQRMGAALTYARRYALFTVVGIAGEDDLDAPDVCDLAGSSLPPVGDSELKPTNAPRRGRTVSRRSGSDHSPKHSRYKISAALPADKSVALRDRLLGELAALASHDNAVGWARGALSEKNSLTAQDAKQLEDAFEQRLSELSHPEMQEEPLTTHTIPPTTTPQALTVHVADGDPPEGIDKSVLAVPEPRRYRNRVHLRFVAQQACLICGRKPSDPHHLGFTQPRALGRKVSDEFTVPLCRGHHRAAHRSRDERAWWRQVGIDPITVARNLWKATLGMGQQPPEPARPDGAAETTNLENEEISAAAERQKKIVQAIIEASKLP